MAAFPSCLGRCCLICPWCAKAINRKPDPRNPDAVFTEVHALLHVERPSQKPMLLGRGGSVVKAIGTEARHGMEALLGARVHLDLHVTVLGEWQDDPKKLNRLGY